MFEGNVHQADQIQTAELTRQALQTVLLSGAVCIEATLPHQSDLETDLLDFITTHLLEFLKTVEKVHDGIGSHSSWDRIPKGFLRQSCASFTGEVSNRASGIQINDFAIQCVRFETLALPVQDLSVAEERLLI